MQPRLERSGFRNRFKTAKTVAGSEGVGTVSLARLARNRCQASTGGVFGAILASGVFVSSAPHETQEPHEDWSQTLACLHSRPILMRSAFCNVAPGASESTNVVDKRRSCLVKKLPSVLLRAEAKVPQARRQNAPTGGAVSDYCTGFGRFASLLAIPSGELVFGGTSETPPFP